MNALVQAQPLIKQAQHHLRTKSSEVEKDLNVNCNPYIAGMRAALLGPLVFGSNM